MDEAHVPIEELLVHRDWLAALCRRVVAGDAEAEDLAQETWVAALDRPPRRGGSVRGWLAAVARNLAFKRARGRARAQRRGERIARADGTPGGVAVAARVELEREVARRVLDLDEPYRTAVLLRYYEGLAPVEIARREGVAPSSPSPFGSRCATARRRNDAFRSAPRRSSPSGSRAPTGATGGGPCWTSPTTTRGCSSGR